MILIVTVYLKFTITPAITVTLTLPLAITVTLTLPLIVCVTLTDFSTVTFPLLSLLPLDYYSYS